MLQNLSSAAVVIGALRAKSVRIDIRNGSLKKSPCAYPGVHIQLHLRKPRVLSPLNSLGMIQLDSE